MPTVTCIHKLGTMSGWKANWPKTTWIYQTKFWILWAIFLSALVLRTCQGFKTESDAQGPIFITEPPAHVDFSNFTGTRIECVAHGNPTPAIKWATVDGLPIENVAGLRTILPNGTLVYYPFQGEDYKPNVHAGIYRCSASNTIGTIVSKDVHIRAVVNQYFEVQVYDEFVILGNIAVLKCHIPSFVRDYVIVTSWVRVEGTNIYSTIVPDGRFVLTTAGELYIQNVTVADGSVAFKCETKHRLTGESKMSTPGRIVVTDPKSSISPRITHSQLVVTVKQGDNAMLSCAAQGYPVPVYKWSRVRGKDVIPIESGRRVRQVTSFLFIDQATVQDAGIFRCIVNNSVGEERTETTLRVRVLLSVYIHPQQQVVDVGKSATFACTFSGQPISLVTWLHNGNMINASNRVRLSQSLLEITKIMKEDRGMYQCFVENGEEVVQGAAELRLGDVLPTFTFTFPSMTVQQTTFVSLKCSASGHPPPQIAWALDDMPLPSRRFKTNDHVDSAGDVTSYVNISNARVEDGGNVRCTAFNKAGKVVHVARLNIFGPPHIRLIPDVSAIVGKDLWINCYVSGYPIESIKWEREGNILPINSRQQVFDNGTLFIRDVDRASEEGVFTCIARGVSGKAVRRHVNVKVQVPPLIEPFSFPRAVREGMRARLTCLVTQGDLPITIDWVKDSKRIPADLDVTVRKDDEFSSSLTFTNISTTQKGSYSCIAKNAVASANHTAVLVVDVPPKWLIQPNAKSLIYRTSGIIDCKADGHPPPTIIWKKSTEGENPGKFAVLNTTHSRHRVFSNGSLLLHSVSESDEGYYMCEANNGVGPGLSKVVYITVHASAHFDQKFANHSLRRGDPGMLSCRARGDPPIKIDWMINGEKAVQENHPRYTWNNRVVQDSHESELVIRKVDRLDAGTYSCLASNTYGKDEIHFRVTVEESPDPPENVRISDHGSRTVILAWSPPFDGNSPILRYTLQYINASDEWSSARNRTVFKGTTKATIDSLNPGWFYNFRVLAENVVGISAPSGSIGITTSEEAPSGPPLNVDARALSPDSIKVTWKPPKKDQQNGEILGYYVGHKIYDATDSPNYETVEVNKKGELEEVILAHLRKYTKYSIVVQAYNSVGSGPHSEELIAYTSEDVPSGGPQNLFCSPVDSSSLLVMWDPPPMALQNGLIQGYKIFYQLVPEFNDGTSTEQYTVTTGGVQRITLFQLEKFSNYSIQVLAYTRMGDGVRTEPIYCQTHEDVPGPPDEIMALPMSGNSIIVTWVPPKKSNGIITKYNLYQRSLTREKPETKKQSFPPSSHPWHEVRGIAEDEQFEFWVTASTAVGEGESTKVVMQSAKSKVPAKIATFPQRTLSMWRSDILLHCLSVGTPPPSKQWKFRERVLPQIERQHILPNGSLLIQNIQRTDAGWYSCMVENPLGYDKLLQELKVYAPPLPPHLTIKKVTTNTIEVVVKSTPEEGSAIQGVLLKYKRDFGGWEEVDVRNLEDPVIISNLHCGTRYQLHAAAYNNIGIGDLSKTISLSTKGEVPKVPPQEKVLKINGTWLTIRLAGWPDGGCPVRHFVIQYRTRQQRDFVLVSNNVPQRQEAFYIPDLRPGIIYHLHITAHNDAGSTVAEYEFITSDGRVAGSTQQEQEAEFVPFYLDISIAVPLFSSVTALFIMATAFGFFFKRRKPSRSSNNTVNQKENAYLDCKMVELQKKHRQDVNLSSEQTEAAFITPYKKENDLFQSSEDLSNQYTEKNYIRDVCPYATFRLPEEKRNGEGHVLPMATFTDVNSFKRYPSRSKVITHRADRNLGEQDPHVIKYLEAEDLRNDGALTFLQQYSPQEELRYLKSSNLWEEEQLSSLLHNRCDQEIPYSSDSPTVYLQQTQVPDLLNHGIDSSSSNESMNEKTLDYELELLKTCPENNRNASRRYAQSSRCNVIR